MDQFCGELGLGLVKGPIGPDLGLCWPPQASCIRQTKHSIGCFRQTNRYPDDHETNPVTHWLAGLRSISIMLKSCSEDILTHARVH